MHASVTYAPPFSSTATAQKALVDISGDAVEDLVARERLPAA